MAFDLMRSHCLPVKSIKMAIKPGADIYLDKNIKLALFSEAMLTEIFGKSNQDWRLRGFAK